MIHNAAECIGNKAANLDYLGAITLNHPHFKVPRHHAVTHQTVYDFLKIHADGIFDPKWNEFCEAIESSKGLFEREKTLLSEIRTLVKATFQKHGTLLPDIKIFLAMVPADCRVIVRSSGLEDTVKLANAGGNKTCINISPTEENIAEAMGKVAASYFSERSIGQRLQAGDTIAKEPFMPVLLQEMVGESVEGDISASGVIFADESTGRTPAVSCIEGAWGHNELVVGGLGPVDRYFVGPNGRIHSVIAYKPNRLFPVQTGKGLIWKQNAPNLRLSPALDAKMLRELHTFYQKLKPKYAGAADGEFTQVDHMIANLFLLQVRPLPHKEKLKPSYLHVAALREKPLAKALSLVSADCRVRVVEDCDELYCDSTIAVARRAFLGLDPVKQKKIKLIVVATPGGSNSHEATEFRANNLPVIYLPKEKRKGIIASLEGKKIALLVDVVTGVVGKINRLVEREKELIKEGWSKHPLPAIQTITGASLTSSEVDSYFKELGFCDIHELKLNGYRHEEIIEKIVSEDPSERILAHKMVIKISYLLSGYYKKTPLEERAILVAKQLIHDAKEVWDAYKPTSQATEIEKLYALNWLVATLTQQTDGGIVNADSPYTLLAEHMELENAKKYAVKDELATFLRVATYGLNSSVQDDWRAFCSALSTEGEQKRINQLATILHRVASVNAISYWLHGLFLPKWRACKEVNASVDHLIIETSRSIDALDAADKLKTVRARIEKRKKYESVDQEFMERIPTLYAKQNSFSKLLLSRAVGEVVESLDRMIKEMLVEPLETAKKVEMFQKLLRPYLNIMHSWLKLVDSNDVPGHDTIYEIDRQIGQISEELFRSPKLADQLNISTHFNVAAAQVGSGTNFSRHKPKTLADLFTLAHQNILFSLAYLQKKEDIFTEHLPQKLQAVAKALSSTNMLNLREEEGKQSFVSYPPSLLSVDVDFPVVKMCYNAPQRNHSALFEITATLTPDCGIKNLTVGAKLFGYQAHDMPRMPWAAAYAELAARAGAFEFSKGKRAQYMREEDMVEFTWEVDQSKIDHFAAHLPDYLQLITTSLYTGSRSRQIPIPGGQKGFCFTDNWGMPKLAHNDNSTTLNEYYMQKDVSIDASSSLRLDEAIKNIKRIHPEWEEGILFPTDLHAIAKWHKLVGKL